MQEPVLPTFYAPAERSSSEEIKFQVAQLLKYPLIEELTNAVPEIFIILNDNRQIVYVNRHTLKNFGAENPEELYGLRPGEAFGCMHFNKTEGGCGTTEHCRYCGAVKAILNSLKGNSDMQECRITQQNGNALDLRIWCMPLMIDEKLHSVFVAQNIDNEKRREILERTFFHDILNTAGGLRGIMNILKDSSKSDYEKFKNLIEVSTETLMEEIYAQKDLLAAENNNLKVSKLGFNSLSALEETAAIYQRHEVGMDKNILIAPESCNIDIYSDKRLLKRIIGNMTKNALEASKPAETVTLGCKQASQKVIEFFVHNGRAMSQEAQHQVFQRSFSTKGAGRGIGTWSIKLLTEQYLNGQASFVSSEEEGTIFKVIIPIGSEDDIGISEE